MSITYAVGSIQMLSNSVNVLLVCNSKFTIFPKNVCRKHKTLSYSFLHRIVASSEPRADIRKCAQEPVYLWARCRYAGLDGLAGVDADATYTGPPRRLGTQYGPPIISIRYSIIVDRVAASTSESNLPLGTKQISNSLTPNKK